MSYEVYGCCGLEFAGRPEPAQARILEHIHIVHADDAELEQLSDQEHLERARF